MFVNKKRYSYRERRRNADMGERKRFGEKRRVHNCLITGLSLMVVVAMSCASHTFHPTNAFPRSDQSESEIVTRFRKRIPNLLQLNGVPGIALAVVDRERIIWAEGFGYCDRDPGEHVTSRTPFSVQSTSKAVTTTAILVAVQNGLLSLDTPIDKYLPDFTVKSRFKASSVQQITVRRLLSHTAGFTHEAPCGNNFDPSCPSFLDHIRSISNTWLRYPVGERYSYSNLGVDLAAHILEVLSGVPFDVYVKNELLKPLGMIDSTFNFDVIKKRKDRALGHSKGYAKVPLEVPMLAAGGLYTSAIDLATFVQFHLNRGVISSTGVRLLRPDILAEMYRIPFPVEGQTEGYALGIGMRTRNGHRYFSHGGGGFGFLSDMLWYPEAGLGIVVLTNSSDHQLQGVLAHELLDEFLKTRTDWPIPSSIDDACVDGVPKARADTASRFLGDYVGRFGIKRIENRNGELWAVSGKEAAALYSLSDREMLECSRNGTKRYRFVGKDSGAPSFMVRVDDGETWDYNDGPGNPPGVGTSTWDRYIGEYSLQIWGKPAGNVKIYKKNGYLYLDELRLEEYRPGLFFTSNGEVLDMRSSPPTFKNIRLRRFASGGGWASTLWETLF